MRVLDGEVVVQKLAVGIGHDALGVFGLGGFQGRGHAGIVGVEDRLGDHGQQVAPVVAAFLAIEGGGNVAVVRGGLRVQHLEKCGAVVVVLGLPALRQIGVAGFIGHLDGQLEAGEREEVIAGEMAGDELVVAHVAGRA